MPVQRMLLVVRHVPHCPSSIMLFSSEAEALAFVDPDGGTIERMALGGITHVIGVWADIDPDSLFTVGRWSEGPFEDRRPA